MAGSLVLRRVTRHSWGPDPRRVVMVSVLRQPDDTLLAQVWGAENGTAAELERGDGVTVNGNRVELPDGRVWTIKPPGCSCSVPAALRGFNPAKMP